MSVVDKAEIELSINSDAIQSAISMLTNSLGKLSESIGVVETGSEELKRPLDSSARSINNVGVMSNLASGNFGRMTANILAGIKNILPSFGALTASVMSVKAVLDFSQEAIQFKQLSDSAGVSIERLSQFGTVAQGFGSSANSIASAFGSIAKNMEQAKFGQGAFFDRDLMRQGLQVSVGSSPEETLMNIADRMKDLDGVRANMLAEKLGIPADLVPTLRQGRVALKEMADEAKPLYNQEDVERAYRVQRAITSVKNTFVELSSKLLGVLAPAIESVSRGVSWFFGLFSKYEGLGVAVMSGIFVACIPVLAILTKMAVATVIAFAPFFAIGAIIAGLALVFQDLWVGFKGGDSLIFNIVKKLDEFASKGTFISSIFKMWWEPVKLLGEFLWAIIKPVFVFIEKLQEGLSFTDALKEAWKTFGEGMNGVLDTILERMKQVLEFPKKLVEGIGGFFSGLFGGNKDEEQTPEVKVPEVQVPEVKIDELPVLPTPVAPNGTQNVNNSNSITINNNMNTTVNAQNANARQTQQAVTNAMNTASKNIVAQSSTGTR